MKAYAVVSLLWFRRRQNRPAVVSHPHEEGAYLWFIFLRPVLSSPSNCKSSIFDVLISLYQFITKCRLACIVFYFLIKKKKKVPSFKGKQALFIHWRSRSFSNIGRLKRGVRWHFFLRLVIARWGPPAPSFRWRFTVSTTRLRQCTVSVCVYNFLHLHLPWTELSPRPTALRACAIITAKSKK